MQFVTQNVTGGPATIIVGDKKNTVENNTIFAAAFRYTPTVQASIVLEVRSAFEPLLG